MAVGPKPRGNTVGACIAHNAPTLAPTLVAIAVHAVPPTKEIARIFVPNQTPTMHIKPSLLSSFRVEGKSGETSVGQRQEP